MKYLQLSSAAQSSIALEQHAWELIITDLSVTPPGLLLRGGLKHVYIKQDLGKKAAAEAEDGEGEDAFQ